MTKTAKLSTGEKALLIAVSIFAALLLGIVCWRYTLEINPEISVPAPVLPQANALEYYVKASDLINDLQVTVNGRRCVYGIDNLESLYRTSTNGQVIATLPTAADQPAPTWEMAEAYAKGQAPAFATLHQGFTLDYHDIWRRSSTQQTQEDRFHTLRQYRKFARVLVLAGSVDAHHGDWASATDCALDAVQLGEEIQHGGGLTANSISRACQAVGRSGAWTAIAHLNSAQAHAAARRMETLIARTPPYADILQEEKYNILASLNESFHKPGWRGEVLGQNEGGSSYFEAVRFGVYSKRNIVQHVIRSMDLAIADAKQPYASRNTSLFDPANTLNQIAGLSFIGSYRFWLTINDTQNALLLISYALQAYYAEHSRYPDKLSELTPAYLTALPSDPFASNKPLCYQRRDSHYLLYSIGPDGVDNGGKASSDGQEDSRTRGAMSVIRSTSSGDIVAGVNVR